jgi:hypothetical protein
MRQYKLPNGKITHSAERYCREWGKLRRKLEQALGVRVSSCGMQVMGGAGFACCSKEDQDLTADIPFWLMERIVELFEDREQHE